jgi:uncharacterized protein (DUF924 family)
MSIATSTAADWRDVDSFWFPPGLEHADVATHLRMFDWWMGGGANAELGRFAPAVDAALRGELDGWAATARGRLALVLVLDQFTRGLSGGAPAAYAGDRRALALAEEGLANGHCEALAWPWERIFLLMPLSHAEGPGHLARQERLVGLVRDYAEMAPERLRPVYRASVRKAEEHRDTVARFGRFPHRNPILGRPSTPEEEDYLRAGRFTHRLRLEID